jgi:diguanylate cyclase (GGDEF)-like protein
LPILVFVVGGNIECEYAFNHSPVVIGRVKSNDITIRNTQVSRKHAHIILDEQETFIEDLGSTNYVFLNRVKINRAKLNHGDIINIGGVADFIYLSEPDPKLTESAVETIRSNPDFAPETYKMKATMTQLVDELSAGSLAPSASDPSGNARQLSDIEVLYEIGYAINSSRHLNDVLDVIICKMLQIVEAERGFILLIDPDTGELEVSHARNNEAELPSSEKNTYSRTVAIKTIEAGQLYASTNAQEDPISSHSVINYAIREVICVPLNLRREIIGVLYADTRQAKGGFSRKDMLFFEAISHQAAIAIGNARLTDELEAKQGKLENAYEELRARASSLQIVNTKLDQKVEELSALNAVSKGVNLVSDLSSILQLILEKSVSLMKAERGSLMLCDEKQNTLNVEATCGFPEGTSQRKTLSMDDGIGGLALAKTTPVSLTDRETLEQLDIAALAATGIHSQLCVPLILNERKVGVINIINKKDERFSDHDKSLSMTLANQAAITIENVRLYNLAVYDGLTGLHDKRYFTLWLDKEFERTKRYKGELSLVSMDIDNFKSFNDTYGHLLGDDVLKMVSSVMKETARTVDLPARCGGEEFSVILPETGEIGAMNFAERLRYNVANATIEHQGEQLRVTLSIGITTVPILGAISMNDMIEQADKAMYLSKKTGKNKVSSYSEIIADSSKNPLLASSRD